MQQALLAQGKGRSYDGATALRLLPCDADCAAQPKRAKPPPQQPKPAAAPEPAPEEQAPGGSSPAKGGAVGGVGAKRLSRAEREALAAQRLEEQERAARREALLRWAALAAVLLVLALIVWGLAKGFSHLDARLQQSYRPEL